MSRSRTSLPGLLARQVRSDLGPLLALAAIVLVIATLATAAPLAVRALTTAEVGYQVDSMPASRRDLIAREPGSPTLDKSSTPFASFATALSEVREEAPPPLRRTLGEPQFLVSVDSTDVVRLGGVWNDPLTPIKFTVDPLHDQHVRMAEGSFPAALTALPPTFDPRTYDANMEFNDSDVIEIALSVATAKRGEWKVGEVRQIYMGPLVRLSGTFDAIDTHDAFWAIAGSALEPGISHTPFSGTNTLVVTGAAFINPLSWPLLAPQYGSNTTTIASLPFTTKGLNADEDVAVLPQLRSYLSLAHSVAHVARPDAVSSVTFGSSAEAALQTALDRSATATVVLAMVASGPLGVAVATLWLLSRLIVLRRRDALALASARGAAGWQLRFSQALDCALFSVPAAAVGAVLAIALFPGSWTPLAAVFAVIVALVPPLLLALAASPSGLRRARGDLDPAGKGRFRWVLELIVVASAALALYLLLQRGLTTTAETIGVDPLLAATPLLLAVAAGLLVLRVYPLPLLAFARRAKSRKGIVSFLGAHRSIRDPAAGLAPVLAMIVGLSVAVFSGVLLGTLSGGVATAAHSTVGADLRIDSPILDAQKIDDIAAVKGVELAVPIYQYTRLINLSAGENVGVPIVVADTSALATVQAGVPGAAHLERDMAKLDDGKVPVLLSPDLAAQYRIGSDSTLGSESIVSAGDPGISPSLSGVADWVLIDRAQAGVFSIEKFLPRITLIALAPGADPSTVATALAAIAGPESTVTSPADVARQLEDSPVSGGLQLALLGLIVLVALLCAATVVLALMISAPARERLLALLRTLGLTPRQARGITGWEIGPTSVVAIVTGVILGAVLPLLVLAGVDLRPFTGGTRQPAVTLDPLILALVLGGFVVLVTLSTMIAIAAARRVNLSRTLRTSEEG